jgi:2,5-diketo-D-gluconate reductase B
MTSQNMPPMGLGTYGRTGKDGLEAILQALEIGYRHLDTAQSYDTESNVGEALARCGLPRGDVFVTTKVATDNLGRDRFGPSIEDSLRTLGVDQIDLTLIHWPSPGNAVPLEHYIEELALAKQRGLTRLIGVSNFPIALLERAEPLLGKGEIATDQVEIHPYLQNSVLVDHCLANGITPTAYLPLVRGRVADEPVLKRIAERYDANASQIALAWLLQRGIAVIPASSNRDRMRSNFEARSLRLTDEDRVTIDALDHGERLITPHHSPDWD